MGKRQLDAPEDYARVQIARLTKALRCADESLEEGNVKAIAPFLKIARERSLYNGVNVCAAGPGPAALPENSAYLAAACAHAFPRCGGHGRT